MVEALSFKKDRAEKKKGEGIEHSYGHKVWYKLLLK